MYVNKENHKYVHHITSRLFQTDVFHHATPDHQQPQKQHKQKKQQTPQLGFNSIDYGEIEEAKEAKEGARPIKRHHNFNDDDTTAIRCVGDGQHHRDDNH